MKLQNVCQCCIDIKWKSVSYDGPDKVLCPFLSWPGCFVMMCRSYASQPCGYHWQLLLLWWHVPTDESGSVSNCRCLNVLSSPLRYDTPPSRRRGPWGGLQLPVCGRLPGPGAEGHPTGDRNVWRWGCWFHNVCSRHSLGPVMASSVDPKTISRFPSFSALITAIYFSSPT